MPAGSHVQWQDWVYNDGRDPSDIYDSARTGGELVNEGHVNSANFRVDEGDGYTLTIMNLKFDEGDLIGDAGEYVCVVDGEEKSYMLDVFGKFWGNDVKWVQGVKFVFNFSVT